jgi:hypothetical protein
MTDSARVSLVKIQPPRPAIFQKKWHHVTVFKNKSAFKVGALEEGEKWVGPVSQEVVDILTKEK